LKKFSKTDTNLNFNAYNTLLMRYKSGRQVESDDKSVDDK